MKVRNPRRGWPRLAARAAGLAVVALALIAGLSLGDNASATHVPQHVIVGQTNGGGPNGVNQYNAASIVITPGTTVTWASAPDGRRHDVQSQVVPAGEAAFYSGDLDSDIPPATFSRTLNTAGTYTYYCTLHADPLDASLANVDARIAAGIMVGKIVVAAPDTTPPTTSAVAATPNPTNGASAVTLTATVADTGTPLSNIAAAEYFIDVAGANGTGTAMSAADGSFNATSEGVTASVSVSGLTLGDHTLFVRGRDAAGNWGATASTVLSVTAPPSGAETASISITGGSLTLGTSPIAFGTIALTGIDQTVDTAPAPPWYATDARGTGTGWNITVSSTNFTSAGGTITVDNFKMQVLNANIVTVAGNAPPASQVVSYQPLSGVPAKYLSAAAGTGMGTYDFTPDARLTVPAETAPGNYQAFMTVSINSGP